MKLRTKVDLKDSLDADFSWRKPELTQILANVKSTKGITNAVALRTAVLLLYAHWEGFIKHAASAYLNFVTTKSLPYKNLTHCFKALALKQKIKTFDDSAKATIHTQFLEYINSCANDTAQITDNGVISTGSNLKSTILKEILTTIGIDYSPYELKANLIDEQLLNYRNTIAHGQRLRIDEKEYVLLHSEILAMMTSIKTEIENSVALDKYLVP